MAFFVIFLLALASYLIGSIPTGYILARIVKKTDIRKFGSNSTGATNTTRVLGIKYGLLALFFDAFKGIIIMIILVAFNLKAYYIIDVSGHETNILAIYGLTAVIGHIFPIYLGFKGGKAVATSFGIVCFLTPVVGIIIIPVFIAIVFITRYVSLASMASAITVVISAILFAVYKVEIFGFPIIPFEHAAVYSFLATIILIRHKHNIIRLFRGEENKIFTSKK